MTPSPGRVSSCSCFDAHETPAVFQNLPPSRIIIAKGILWTSSMQCGSSAQW
jgi:hypothetical protein